MNYHPDDFLELSRRVEADGGTVLPEACKGSPFKIKKRVNGKLQWRQARTTHCGLHARLGVHYDPSQHVRLRDDDDVILVEHRGEAPKPDAIAVVCAVDDSVGLWPRYADTVTKRSYEP